MGELGSNSSCSRPVGGAQCNGKGAFAMFGHSDANMSDRRAFGLRCLRSWTAALSVSHLSLATMAVQFLQLVRRATTRRSQPAEQSKRTGNTLGEGKEAVVATGRDIDGRGHVRRRVRRLALLVVGAFGFGGASAVVSLLVNSPVGGDGVIPTCRRASNVPMER